MSNSVLCANDSVLDILTELNEIIFWQIMPACTHNQPRELIYVLAFLKPASDDRQSWPTFWGVV